MQSISKSKLSSVILILFFVLTPISIYYNLELILSLSLLIISLPFWIVKNNKKVNPDRRLLTLWLIFILISCLSTLIFQHSNSENYRGILYEVILFISIYPISLTCDTKYFFITFRNVILILGIFGIISQITHWDPFYGMRSRALLTEIDTTSGGGISSLFEYRHYYATFLVFSIIITCFFPIRNVLGNVLANVVLIMNLLLTYTRNAWIAFIILAIVFIAQNHSKIKLEISFRGLYSFLILIILLIIILGVFWNNIQPVLINVGNRFNQVVIDSNQYGGASGVRGYVINEGISYFLSNWKRYLLIGGGNGFALQWLRNNPYGLTIHWNAAIDVQYVTTIMNSGILGLYCLLRFLYLNSKKLFKKDILNRNMGFIFIGFFIMFWFYDVIPFMSSIFVFWNICVCFSLKNKD